MKTSRTMLCTAVALALAAAMAWAEGEVDNPGLARPGLKPRALAQARALKGGPDQQPDAPGAAGRPLGPAGSYIDRFLETHPRFAELVKKHHEEQQAILEQLRALRRDTLENARAAQTPEERRRIVEGSKDKATELVTALTDGAIAFRKKALALLEEHKDEVIQQAVNAMFAPPAARPRILGEDGGEVPRRRILGEDGGEVPRPLRRPMDPAADGAPVPPPDGF